MVKSPSRLLIHMYFRGRDLNERKVHGCSTRSDLCSTPKLPVAVSSQSNTDTPQVKENATSPKVKSFLSSLGLSLVEAEHLPMAG